MSDYLAMALVHGRKPSRYYGCKTEQRFARDLSRYTCKSSERYDPVFDRLIRELRPDWFMSNKKRLLELAKSGAKRPGAKYDPRGLLCVSLYRYTCKSNGYYDLVFDKKIRELRPDWFISTADIKKKKLFELAKSGAKRPSKKSKNNEEIKLGGALSNYSCRHGECYDLVFDREIRELRPDWFENTADIKKEKLLELAKSGAKRPSKKSKNNEERKLAGALSRYTASKNDKCYDPVFDEKIRKLKPDWFLGRRK